MELEHLIDQVEETAISDEPLDQLSAAMGVKAEVDDLTDTLIGHFVDQARRAGCSWSEIGEAMGVTKQAAQQRHTSERPKKDRPWRTGRFTPRARNVVREAQAAAGSLGHSYLGTEHLLLGILAVSQSLGAKVLAGRGVTYEQVVDAVKAAGIEAQRSRGRGRHLPLTPRAKQALQQATTEALGLGHNYVGTEHILLALRRDEDGLAGRFLAERGIAQSDLHTDVVKLLAAA